MHIASLMKIPYYLLKLSSGNENMGVSRADNSVKIWRNLPISNPKPDLLNVNAYSVWWKSLVIYSSYSPETKIRACLGQITPSKFDEICPLAIPNQISTMSMHIPSLVKIHWCLVKLSSGNENMGMSRAENSIKNWRHLPISNPKPDLNNINAYTKFGENTLMFTQDIIRKRKTDGQTDGLTDDQRVTIIPRHYCVAGYKNVKHCDSFCCIGLDKSGYQVKSFLISQRKHMLWVLIRSASLRCF